VITSGVQPRSYTTRIGRIREQEEEDFNFWLNLSLSQSSV